MEMLIERLAVPNFWLRPMISSDYVQHLPVWNYAGNKEEILAKQSTSSFIFTNIFIVRNMPV